MASFAAAACRASVRLARHQLGRDVTTRAGYRTSAAVLAAQNFTMPALSPTMTEGNIAKWQVKEGDKFSAGDVLLEIETDKATMDVEAQEDGILMKIVQGDGTKAIQVGTRIAVIAEEGDDISSLELPPDEGPKQSQAAAAEPAKTEAAPAAPSEAAAAPPTPAASSKPAQKSTGKTTKQRYPPLPSVIHLLKVNGLDESVLAEVNATGPNGRILKGDVLAYLGKINAQIPTDISSRFEHNSHLDLSNIKVAKAPEQQPKKAAAAAAAAPEIPKETIVELSVSVAAISAVQKRLQSKAGLEFPFSSFIFRAADIANESLPRVPKKVNTDRLFNEILGVSSEADYFSRGAYLPDVGTVRSVSVASSVTKTPPAKTDLLDILAGKSGRSTKKVSRGVEEGVLSGPAATFSLTVPSAEAERAAVFLQRMKVLLEKEPEKLVL
ncbi:hypothetical protein QBC47DRAFT_460042 [Echria macrotheca]|uniref:Uncharacterized protein n=1 Tax=Echria macrotheca TaxID=438768 RepID=A0AAJ0FC82_9PEZI|nr:hypothetical protein QBC47DRAFT_460042 [Echria macrotheca]